MMVEKRYSTNDIASQKKRLEEHSSLGDENEDTVDAPSTFSGAEKMRGPITQDHDGHYYCETCYEFLEFTNWKRVTVLMQLVGW